MPGAVERVVLLGFMASGKTTIGRLLAERLGWPHLDFDDEIERLAGRSIPEIFEREGEPAFRRLEAEITPRLVSMRNVVLTPGGGWVTNPALPGLLPADSLTVWLAVSPEEVVRRLGFDPEARERPLLRGSDPTATARRLLAEREPLYRRAELVVQTDLRSPAEVARELESVVRGRMRPPL